MKAQLEFKSGQVINGDLTAHAIDFCGTFAWLFESECEMHTLGSQYIFDDHEEAIEDFKRFGSIIKE